MKSGRRKIDPEVFVTEQITNAQVYDRIVKMDEKLDTHIQESQKRAIHIKYLWSAVSGLTVSCGAAFLYLIGWKH